MPKPSEKPTVRLRPASYQPTRAELEEDMSISDTTPEELARVIGRQVKVEKTEEGARSESL